MALYKIDSAYSVISLSNHNIIKENLISLINSSYGESIYDGVDRINDTDWNISSNSDREWVKYFLDNCSDQIVSLYQDLGYATFQIESFWYQRYKSNDHHGWHSHPDTTFSNVYYLELPEESAATEIISPYYKNIVEINAREGDLLTFPAYLNHRAPTNISEKNRTVIVFNTYASYSSL
jgi:hypothetical protein